MKRRSALECIKRILRDIDKRRCINPMDYADRNFVRRYNAAMDRIVENAHYLWDNYPDQRELFLELVCSSDYIIAAHCAHVLYGMKDSAIEHKRLALAVVKKLVDHPEMPDISRFAMSLNIKQWEAELGGSS